MASLPQHPTGSPQNHSKTIKFVLKYSAYSNLRDFFVVVKEVPTSPNSVSDEGLDASNRQDAKGFSVDGGYGDFGVRPLGVPKDSIGMFDKTFFVIDDGVCNAKFVPLPYFKAMIFELQHEALECLFLPPQFVSFL